MTDVLLMLIVVGMWCSRSASMLRRCLPARCELLESQHEHGSRRARARAVLS
jgi:hypothetical protein